MTQVGNLRALFKFEMAERAAEIMDVARDNHFHEPSESAQAEIPTTQSWLMALSIQVGLLACLMEKFHEKELALLYDEAEQMDAKADGNFL